MALLFAHSCCLLWRGLWPCLLPTTAAFSDMDCGSQCCLCCVPLHPVCFCQMGVDHCPPSPPPHEYMLSPLCTWLPYCTDRTSHLSGPAMQWHCSTTQQYASHTLTMQADVVTRPFTSFTRQIRERQPTQRLKQALPSSERLWPGIILAFSLI